MDLIRKAIQDCEKYEIQRSYEVEDVEDYDFKSRQEAYYIELLCNMYELLKKFDTECTPVEVIKGLLQIAKGLLVFSDPATVYRAVY